MQPRHVISPSFGASTAVVPSHGRTAWTKARRFRPQRARANLYGMPARKQACGSRASVSAPLLVRARDCGRGCDGLPYLRDGRCRHARRAAAAHPARRYQSDLLLPAARGPQEQNFPSPRTFHAEALRILRRANPCVRRLSPPRPGPGRSTCTATASAAHLMLLSTRWSCASDALDGAHEIAGS